MRKTKHQILSLILAGAMLLCSCRSVTVKPNESIIEETTTISEATNNTSPEALEMQEKFDQLTDDIFYDTLSQSSITAHSYISDLKAYGLTDLPYSLGDTTEEFYLESIEDYEAYLEDLEDINYDLLTSSQQLTYDILVTDINDSVAGKDFYGFEDYLSPLSGVPVNVPSFFSVFELNNEQDVIDYISILKEVPSYYDSMLEYETMRSEKGIGAPDYEIDDVIDSCNEFIANKDNHFLITSFDERINEISGLSTDKKNQYISENKEIILNKIIPCYQNLITKLATLKGKNKTDGGLANYDKGKDYYEYIVRVKTGSDMSISEIKNMLEEKCNEHLTTFYELSLKDETLYDNMENYPMDTSDPDKVLEYLLENIDDFPSGYETNYTINYVPKDIEKYESPAYYYIPHIDNITNNQIYINQSEDYKDQDLYPLLAHEGFPGHMYQTTYFQNTNPTLLRNLFNFNGYVEGWGLYSELYSYGISGQSKDQVKFNVAISCLSYDLYCLADIGINYEGWTREDTKDFITGMGYNESIVDEVFETLVENPGVYLSYYVGYLEFLSLRDTAENELGKSFNIKAFHKFILDMGPCQFEIVKKHFDAWLYKQKNVA